MYSILAELVSVYGTLNRLMLFQEKKMTGFYFLTMRHPLPTRRETDLKNYACSSHTLLLSCSFPLSLYNTWQLWPQHGFNATAESIGLNLAIIGD